MNKFIIGLIATVVLILLSACRPPEVEGTVINIQKQLYDEALVSAKNAIEKYPENAEAWFYWGWLNGEQKGNYEVMNEAFNKVLALNPSQNVTFEGQSVPAKSAIEQVRTNKFAEFYNSAIKTIPKARETEDQAQKTKMFEEARDKLRTAIKVAPNRTEPYRPLAMSYIALGDTAQAESVLEDGITKQPKDEIMLISAAEIYSMAHKYDRAVELLRKAAEVNPDNSVIYQKLGVIESERENWDEANEYYQKAIELDPENSDLTYNIGVSYYNQQEFEEAIPYFEKSLEVEPNNELIYTVLAGCYVRAEKVDKGITFLEDAVQRYPEKADLWEFLAILYGKKGMKEKADEAFKKSQEVKEMNP